MKKNKNTVNTPASLASSSLGMPLILLCFTDEHFLFSCVWALNFTQLSILSTIPQLVACRGQRDKRFSWWCPAILHRKPKEKSARSWQWMRSVLTALTNLSDKRHLDPKLFVWSVIFSLVWESKEGFSIRAFTNTQIWFFTWSTNDRMFDHFSTQIHKETTLKNKCCTSNPTWKGLTDTPALFFFFTTSISLATIWSTT